MLTVACFKRHSNFHSTFRNLLFCFNTSKVIYRHSQGINVIYEFIIQRSIYYALRINCSKSILSADLNFNIQIDLANYI
jgi:hypothetical protein